MPIYFRVVSMEFYCLCYLTVCQLHFGFFGLFTVCFLLQLQNLLRAGNPSTCRRSIRHLPCGSSRSIQASIPAADTYSFRILLARSYCSLIMTCTSWSIIRAVSSLAQFSEPQSCPADRSSSSSAVDYSCKMN